MLGILHQHITGRELCEPGSTAFWCTTLSEIVSHVRNPITNFIGAHWFGLALLVFNYFAIMLLWDLYETWDENFGRKKVGRRSSKSPSNKSPPSVRPWQDQKDEIIGAANLHKENFRTSGLISSLEKQNGPTDSNTRRGTSIVRKRASMFASMVWQNSSQLLKGSVGKIKGTLRASLKAAGLDMDHVYVTFPQYLWAMVFVGVPAGFLWGKGVTGLLIRKKLAKWGIIKAKWCDPALVVGHLCLEGTMSINYYSRATDENADKDVAAFYYPNFPIVSHDGTVKIHDLFAISVDLKSKRMVEAKLDDEVLSPDEAMILAWFNTIAMNHVKLHALANWGVNVVKDQFAKNPFPARNSLVTVMYNYFGYVSFGTFFGIWKKMGLLGDEWESHALKSCFDIGVHDNITAHPNIVELTKHSRMVSFIVKTRALFMKEFQAHRQCFPGVHGEALFVGTVLHSLDHTIMDRNLDDPLWLNTDDPRFGRMAELGQIVKVGFVKDVPGLYFHKRFKGSGHPFYEAVYRKAAVYDKDLADHMDTCIVK